MRPEARDRLWGFSTSFGITFLAMMVVLGTVCIFAYFSPEEETGEARPDAYLPGTEDRLVMLLSAAEDGETPPDTYLLLGFLPDQGRIALCVLPPSTYLEYGGQGSTLGRLWSQGGLGYAQKGLADYLGIPIDRRGALDTAGLSALMEFGGLVDYDLAVDISYTLHGRQVVMPRGKYQLDGRRAMDIIACPSYRGGERERSDRAALLISRLITGSLPAFLTDAGAELQRTALEVMDTDLSAADCLRRSSALQFLARLKLPATTAVFLEGSMSRDYTVFHLTESCKARIREMYCLPGEAPEGELSSAPAPSSQQPQSPSLPPPEDFPEENTPENEPPEENAPEEEIPEEELPGDDLPGDEPPGDDLPEEAPPAEEPPGGDGEEGSAPGNEPETDLSGDDELEEYPGGDGLEEYPGDEESLEGSPGSGDPEGSPGDDEPEEYPGGNDGEEFPREDLPEGGGESPPGPGPDRGPSGDEGPEAGQPPGLSRLWTGR